MNDLFYAIYTTLNHKYPKLRFCIEHDGKIISRKYRLDIYLENNLLTITDLPSDMINNDELRPYLNIVDKTCILTIDTANPDSMDLAYKALDAAQIKYLRNGRIATTITLAFFGSLISLIILAILANV